MCSMVVDGGLDVWQPDGCDVRVEYSRSVMEDIRLSAVEGFNRLKHGAEIGGVLFGVCE